MLQGDVQHLFRHIVEYPVDSLADPPVVSPHLLDTRPVGGLIVGQVAFPGVDAEREQLVKGLLERGHVKSLPANQVPVKGFQMTQIENDAVTFGNWTLVE